MLNYQDIQPYDSSIKPLFRFKKLKLENQAEGIYTCTQTNLRYKVSFFTNHHQVQLLHALWEKGIFGNIKGFFKKKNNYFCITDVESFFTLADLVERQKENKQYFSQYFCSQLIESVLDIATICDELGCKIKILDPFKIIVNEKDKIFTFKLTYPYCHSLFECLSPQIVLNESEFCAPEILILENNANDLERKQFPKAVLYSLGLLILFCFGYRIKSQERIQALRKNKDFNKFLKMIRKEIKIIHGGKFIPKIIKILMEQSDHVRDTIETFVRKYKSPHLMSLKKFVFEQPELPSGMNYIPTIYSDNSDPINRGSMNRTIEIQGSSFNTINKSELYSPQNNRDNLGNSSLTVSFKKSPELISKQNLNLSKASNLSIEKEKNLKKSEFSLKSNQSRSKEESMQEQKMREEDCGKSNLSSPIDIYVDWSEMDADDIQSSQKRPAMKSHRSIISKKDIPDVIQELDQNEIGMTIVITNANRQQQTYKFQKQIKKTQNNEKNTLSKSQKLQEEEKLKTEQRKEAKQSESTVELHQISIKKKISNEGNESSKTFHKRFATLVEEQEEEPEIIKYFEEDPQVNQVKFMKKKISSGSTELQAMSLVEENDDNDEDLGKSADERTNQNYDLMKKELNKKSEAIFIIVLISFLLYKLIDFVISLDSSKNTD